MRSLPLLSCELGLRYGFSWLNLDLLDAEHGNGRRCGNCGFQSLLIFNDVDLLLQGVVHLDPTHETALLSLIIFLRCLLLDWLKMNFEATSCINNVLKAKVLDLDLLFDHLLSARTVFE